MIFLLIRHEGSKYPLIIKHSHGKSPCLIGKPSINGPFSMAMLNNQRVDLIDMKPSTKQFSVRIWLCYVMLLCFQSGGCCTKEHVPASSLKWPSIHHKWPIYHDIYCVYIYIYISNYLNITSLNSLNILKHSALPKMTCHLRWGSCRCLPHWFAHGDHQRLPRPASPRPSGRGVHVACPGKVFGYPLVN